MSKNADKSKRLSEFEVENLGGSHLWKPQFCRQWKTPATVVLGHCNNDLVSRKYIFADEFIERMTLFVSVKGFGKFYFPALGVNNH